MSIKVLRGIARAVGRDLLAILGLGGIYGAGHKVIVAVLSESDNSNGGEMLLAGKWRLLERQLTGRAVLAAGSCDEASWFMTRPARRAKAPSDLISRSCAHSPVVLLASGSGAGLFLESLGWALIAITHGVVDGTLRTDGRRFGIASLIRVLTPVLILTGWASKRPRHSQVQRVLANGHPKRFSLCRDRFSSKDHALPPHTG